MADTKILNNDIVSITGSVGIGTASPQVKLDVAGRIKSNYDGNTAWYAGDYVRLFNSQSFRFLNSSGSSIAQINLNGISYFNGGNVGIGTTVPTQKLQVNGVIRIPYNSSNTYYYGQDNGSVGFGKMFPFDNTGFYTFDTNYTSGGGYKFKYNGSEIVRITDSGVGIGEPSPDAPLHIYQPGTSGIKLSRLNHDTIDLSLEGANRFVISNATDSTDLMSILYDSGNVGIGTTSPSYKLSVVTNGDTYSADFYQSNSGTDKYNAIRVRGAMTSAVGYYGIGGSTTGNTAFRDAFVVGTQSSHPFKLATNDTSRLEISAGGYTYIKPSAGASRLYLEGTSGTHFLTGTSGGDFGIYNDTASSYRMFINSAGNVGIGTTSPSAKLNTNLSVEGTILAYQEGTTYTFDGDANIAVTHNSSTMGTGTAAGLLLANNNNSNNAISPLIAFSARSASNSYNHTYAAIYGQKSEGGADTNWNKGDIIFSVSDGTGPKERMRVVGKTGDVGIGTTSPNSRLEVVNSVTFSNVDTFGQFVIKSSSGTTGDLLNFGVDSANSLAFIQANDRGTSSIPLILQRYAGNVGIGTDSPDQNLHISSNVSTGLLLESTYSTTGKQWLINSRGADSSFQIYNETDSVDALRILANGNIGIGTTSPATKLDVSSAGAHGITLSKDTSSTSNSGRLFFETDTVSEGFSFLNSNGLMTIRSGAQSGATSGTIRVAIDTSGNVGIGTTDPTVRLHVGSTGTNPYSSTITRASNMKGIMATLSNNADDMVGIYFATGTTTQGSHWSGITGSRSDSASDWSTQLNFYTHDAAFTNINDATQKMVIKGNGNVGIGTTSPTAKLHVVGGRIEADSNNTLPIFRARYNANYYTDFNSNGITFNGSGQNFNISDNGTNSVIYLKSGGNVGIGTTSPDAKLHVAGDVTFGQKRIVNLPSFSMGAGGITDEYLVICKQAPAGSGVNASGIQGRIVFSRGSSGSYNNSHYIDINIQMSLDSGNVNNLDVNQFEIVTDQTVHHAFTQIEEIDIDGTKYVALKARTTGGGHNNHFYFEGSISDDGADTNILSKVRASDANITVTSPQPSGYPITPYIIKNNSGNIGIGVSPSYKLDVTGDINIPNANAYKIDGTDILEHNTTYTQINNPEGATTIYLGDSADRRNYYDNNGHRFRTAGGVATLGEWTSTGLGIGTTSPSNKLHVIGSNTTAYFQYTEGVNAHIRIADNVDSLYVGSRDGLGFFGGINSASTSNLTVDLTNGNVGIGTTSPARKLHINAGTDNEAVRIESTDTEVALELKDSTGTAVIRSRGDFRFDGSSGEIMRMESGGNVGIGTTTPAAKLHVTGVNQANGHYDDFASFLAEDSECRLQLLSNNDGNDSSHIILSAVQSSTDNRHWVIGHRGPNKSNNFEIGYTTSAAGGNIGTGNFADFLIKTNGDAAFLNNLGIGTTSPSYKLQVARTSNGRDVAYFGGQVRIAEGDPSRLTIADKGGSVNLWNFDNAGGTLRVFREDYASSGTGSNGSVKLAITDGGNVGIGTTTPAEKLDVAGTIRSNAYEGKVKINSTATNGKQYEFISIDTGNLGLYDGTAYRLWVGGNGNIGIGTTSPTDKLEVNGNIGIFGNKIYNGSASNSAGISFPSSTTRIDGYNGITFHSSLTTVGSQTERMRITSSGAVGIGVTSVPTGYKMQVNGSILGSSYVNKFTLSNIDYFSRVGHYYGAMQLAAWNYNNSTSTQSNTGVIQLGALGPNTHQNNVIVSNGNLTVNGSGSFTSDVVAYSSSDKRLKDNVKPIENALDKVIAIGGYEFDWNDNQEIYEGHDVGVIAQEVEEVLPEVVETRKDGYKAVKYEKMVPLLIEAIKDQQKQIEELKALLNGSTK